MQVCSRNNNNTNRTQSVGGWVESLAANKRTNELSLVADSNNDTRNIMYSAYTETKKKNQHRRQPQKSFGADQLLLVGTVSSKTFLCLCHAFCCVDV